MLIIIILFLIITSCIYIILSYKTKGAPLPTGAAKCVCPTSFARPEIAYCHSAIYLNVSAVNKD